MAKTASFIELEARIKTIESNMMPAVNALGIYSDAEIDSIHAFVLLAHAEFECYIEEQAKILALTLENELKNDKAGSRFARYHASKLSNSYSHIISENHGLKSKNLNNLFGPFGFCEDDFNNIDTRFLAAMNSFGGRRGESAHLSAKRITKQPNPIAVQEAIQVIMDCLEKFEAEVIRIRIKGFL